MHHDQIDWDKRELEYEEFKTNVPNDEGQNEDHKSIFNEDTMPETEVDSLGARTDHQKDDDKGVNGLDDLSLIVILSQMPRVMRNCPMVTTIDICLI